MGRRWPISGFNGPGAVVGTDGDKNYSRAHISPMYLPGMQRDFFSCVNIQPRSREVSFLLTCQVEKFGQSVVK